MGTLCYFGHSTVLLEIDGIRILTDPVLVDRLGPLHRHTDAVAHLLDQVDVDVVLISHGHHDHLHAPSISRLGGRPRIVVPRGLGRVVKGRDVMEVVAGERLDVGPLRIDALRAEHDGGRRPFGPAAAALGYRIAGSSRAYFAGDTDLFTEMNDLAGT